MATLQTWVDRTRSHLMSGRSEERNVLSAPYVAGSGTISLTNALGGIVAGSRISIGLNTFYVVSVPTTGSTATVLGGQEGTTDANAASGALVRVGPRFTDFDIVDALATDLADLSNPDNGLFVVSFSDWLVTNGTDMYPLVVADPSSVIDVFQVKVTRDPTLVAQPWQIMAKSLWRLDRMAGVTGLETVPALRVLAQPGLAGSTLRALLRMRFVIPTALTDDLTTTLLPVTAYDIPPMGAAMRLVSTREVKRNFPESQGDTRRAGEVGAGAIAQSMRPLAVLRQSRIQAEAGRLMAQYSDRRW